MFTCPDFRARRMEQEYLRQDPTVAENQAPEGPEGPEGSGDLATQAMAMKTDKVTYEANLQFMQLQNAMLGTAIDMKA